MLGCQTVAGNSMCLAARHTGSGCLAVSLQLGLAAVAWLVGCQAAVVCWLGMHAAAA